LRLEVKTMRLSTALATALLVPALAFAGGVPLVDSSAGSHGSVTASLTKGTVKMKITGLPRLPATQPLGATFDAYVYKAYLTSSTDPAVEVFLADVYPNGSGAAKSKVALKGDLSTLGLDRVVVTAYSKNARDAFDVLTATLQ
jgi:hypothetical protein